jgi:alkylation response protein AidB-like acyl-CoA dehydrogenase
VATVAVPAGFADASAVTAVRAGDAYVLDGVAAYVLDGHVADLVLVPASVAPDAPLALFAISPARAQPGEVLARTPLPALDETRKLARLEFRRTPARMVGRPDAGGDVVDKVVTNACVALASELVGICQWGVAASAEYASARQQFGRPIGTFQAIKHKCVDMLVDLEAVKALAYYAAWTAETNAPELAVMSSLAKAECSDAARTITTETLHVHGGLGFTWEHPAHLYLKRAASAALLFGDAAHHRELVCQGLGL